ncbi:MAG: hypothetical protein WCO60_19030 [Verrucomicrobiota bacterium]
MNRHAKLLTIGALVAFHSVVGLGFDPGEMQEVELDERKLVSVPVSGARVTTISFPSPISAIDAALVTTDGKAHGLFQLAHKPGATFFSVRCLVKDARTNVNVRCNGRTYIVELQDSVTPVLSLVFKNPSEIAKGSAARKAVTPGSLVGLLDKAKAYPLLKASHPEALEQVDYRRYDGVGLLMDYTDFEIHLEEVFRFEAQDTLVFRVLLKNKTDHDIRYRPDGFSLRVGERLYLQSISDASGVLPAQGEMPAYFAVTGTPNGGRNELSTKNEFTVLLARVEPEVVTPAKKPVRKGIEGLSK